MTNDVKAAHTAIGKLKVIQASRDPEIAHSDADEVLCELLMDLGFNEVVAEWRKVRKWYA